MKEKIFRFDGGHNAPWEVHAAQLSELIKTGCQITESEAAARIQKTCEIIDGKSENKGFREHLLGKDFESSTRGKYSFNKNQMSALCHCWGIPLTRMAAACKMHEHPAYIAAKKNDPTNEDGVANDFRILREADWLNDDRSPRNCIYLFPKLQLQGCDDVEICIVKIGPNGKTEMHSHDGDEIIIARNGDLALLLPESGLQIPVRSGDIAHFYAEQEHQVVNYGSSSSEFLVVRHSANRPSGARMLSTHTESTKGSEARLKRVLSEIRDTLEPPKSRIKPSEAAKTFGDRWGLAFLLARAAELDGGVSEVARRWPGEGKPNTNAVSRLTLGHSPVETGKLSYLSELFDLPETVLYEFIQRSDRRIVVHKTGTGFNEYEGEIGAAYQIPNRRLAVLGASISKLTLSTNGEINFHRHPGTELIIPIDGRFQLGFEASANASYRISSESHEYLHFRSDRRHHLLNDGEESSTMWVLRFY